MGGRMRCSGHVTSLRKWMNLPLKGSVCVCLVHVAQGFHTSHPNYPSVPILTFKKIQTWWMFYTSKPRTLAFVQIISELVCLHDSCMFYTTQVYVAPALLTHSHKNSRAWLSALAKTVNGRSKQVVSVHFSFIPITALGTASLPLKHTQSLPPFAAFPLSLISTTPLFIFPW